MSISTAARRLASLLKSANRKVVFAESCTGGLVSGTLTAIPGISEYHCGGVVVYRNETKIAYLKIPPKLLKDVGPVSEQVAALMARRVLDLTPEADLSASVTGHLGPNAPDALDGLVFIAIAKRRLKRTNTAEVQIHKLQCDRADSRLPRQRWVVERVLDLLCRELQQHDGNH